MTQSSPDSLQRFDVTRHAAPHETASAQTRCRRISLPVRMDDGEIRSFDLPSALERPSQFSAAEFERLTRAYAEALGLLSQT